MGFSCHSRDICPSCTTRRTVETAAHLTDNVLPRVPMRQWVLSVPKRVRWFLQYHPAAAGGLLRLFLRAMQTPFFAKLGQQPDLSPKKLRPEEIAQAIVGALEIDDRGFIPEFSVFAANPF